MIGLPVVRPIIRVPMSSYVIIIILVCVVFYSDKLISTHFLASSQACEKNLKSVHRIRRQRMILVQDHCLGVIGASDGVVLVS